MKPIRLKTYMVWCDGKYLGLKDRTILCYLLDYNPSCSALDDFLYDRKDVYDPMKISKKKYTWSRVVEPERQITIGEDYVPPELEVI